MPSQLWCVLVCFHKPTLIQPFPVLTDWSWFNFLGFKGNLLECTPSVQSVWFSWQNHFASFWTGLCFERIRPDNCSHLKEITLKGSCSFPGVSIHRWRAGESGRRWRSLQATSELSSTLSSNDVGKCRHTHTQRKQIFASLSFQKCIKHKHPQGEGTVHSLKKCGVNKPPSKTALC